MAALTQALGYGSIVLQIFALFLLVRGPLSRYFPLFLYLLSYLGGTAYSGWLYHEVGANDKSYIRFYWAWEMLGDLLLFVLVIMLTMRALEGTAARSKVVRLLFGIAGIVLLIPFTLFSEPSSSLKWVQSTSQLLNFGAAIMNLALWSALLVSRVRDRQLMSVSAGLGLTVASTALYWGVRQFTGKDDLTREIYDIFYRVVQFISPLIWCWAFRPSKKKTEAKPEGGSHGLPTSSAPSPSAS